MSVRTTQAALVILDISGYTRFIHRRVISLEHAESIISELLEAIIDRASEPLLVNKLEGDAALLYAEVSSSADVFLRGIVDQVNTFFQAFNLRSLQIRSARSHCGCEACANVDSLRLKAIIHSDEIVVKQVRQFQEIAGDAVILLHRLLKNDVPSQEYVMLTDAAYGLLADGADNWQSLVQPVEGMSPCKVHWRAPAVFSHVPIAEAGSHRLERSAVLKHPSSTPRFRHLPTSWPTRLRRLLRRVLRS